MARGHRHPRGVDDRPDRPVSATTSDRDVPFVYAAHPYLTVGEETVDDVGSGARRSYLSRPGPAAAGPGVAGGRYAAGPAEGPALGSRNLDNAMTDLARDADGRWRVTLSRAGRAAELWGDETMRWVQVFTGGPYRDRSIAVEPMTCGPDAYNEGPTHDDLIVLAPGDTFTGRWGVHSGNRACPVMGL